MTRGPGSGEIRHSLEDLGDNLAVANRARAGDPAHSSEVGPSTILVSEVRERMAPFYVYMLLDPRTDPPEPFYVGKGTGARLLSHGKAAERDSDERLPRPTISRIRAIRKLGLEPNRVVVRHAIDEEQAFLVEAALIDVLPGLTNAVHGHRVETASRLLRNSSAATEHRAWS